MARRGLRLSTETAQSGARTARAFARGDRVPAVPEVALHGDQEGANVARLLSGQASDPLHFFVPSRWWLMGPALLGVTLLLSVLSRTLPMPVVAASMSGGIMISASATMFAWLEGRLDHRNWRRYPLMLVAVASPMALFGYAVARWTAEQGPLAWNLTIGAFVIVMLIAAALLEGRLTSIIAATLAAWSGVAVFDGSMTSMLMFGMGSCFGLYLVIRQSRKALDEASSRAQREREQRRAEELLNEYEETGQGWFWETDRRGHVTYVSPRIAQLLGKEPSALEGKPFTGLFALETQAQESERTLPFHLSTRSSFRELSVRAATGENEERWWSISGRPVMDQFNNFMGFRGSGTDLTETRKSQQHVTQLARFDSLTQLANRYQMAEWLEKVLTAPRVDSRACAVFLLDLDRFKQVNDTMGHPAGDALLKQVAQRLTSTVADMGRVGRLGGDEFQVILPGYHQREGLAHLARRIIENLSHPYSIDGARVVIGASLGISVCPDDGTSAEELIRNADLALYAAKGGGRGRHHFYDDDLHSDAKERQQLEEDLRDAIANGALELHYQPQVRTITENITGFEALLRWNHPRHGYMSPAKFVPIAEETGLVSQIGEWALRTACSDLATWPENVRVAVNVSPLQFANPSLPAIVTSAIAAAGIVPSRLELEITESVFLGDDRSTETMFAALKGIGVRLALDDFGTGYSSLGYLKKAPFDKIKIDQSFVRGATVEGSRNGAIISSIVSLAEALGMETTAEGVETLDELDLVRLLGCSHVQGHIYERALTSEAAAQRLAQGLAAEAQGPRSARAPRQRMLRKVVLQHGQHVYNGTIRNISQTGALIEGLWNVPPGTEFGVHLAEGYLMMAIARWGDADRMGVQFAQPMELDGNGSVLFTPPRPKRERREQPGTAPDSMKRAG
ncbi:EAL domain-containing protein [Novosphingobium album (ex Hu et al. 2023)]|uniref:EAL domain-containing protein n=1 Tax=Novosphingobium album (ex Hu et al. 2023) TaxID=2930093 RepID=A0ABT0AZ23_9SPHN|nr:EAL domain-containing protein [Novosphingobium album (ex Hu et al. 2023)]MCJ2178039.1 EAL domain-containing protein [Novosphingobium album (ex Hu et al. 2023)]